MNTRILHVFGGEKSARGFYQAVKDGKISKEQLWEDSYQEQSPLQYTDGDDEFEYEAYKFGTVDPAFIDFVTEHFVDNQVSEDNDFHVVGNGAV